jgi:hypothetical protein
VVDALRFAYQVLITCLDTLFRMVCTRPIAVEARSAIEFIELPHR